MVAAMFALFGQSSFTLGLTPVVLDVVAAVLVWRIGRRLFGSKSAWARRCCSGSGPRSTFSIPPRSTDSATSHLSAVWQ